MGSTVPWLARVVVAVILVGGIIAVEALKIPCDWLNQHLNQVLLVITFTALLCPQVGRPARQR
jgi:hypothetical protein